MNDEKKGRTALTYRISEAEAGMKLLRFLERGQGLPRPLLYRWLRSGQVRVNKGRAKPDLLLKAGDEVRLPPQAAVGGVPDRPAASGSLRTDGLEFSDLDFGEGLRLLYADRHYLVLEKAAGLPVQPGSGHTDSVSSRLQKAAARLKDDFGRGGAAEDLGEFVPAPAHRLDRQSSGILLAGRTHIGQRYLHSLFAGEAADEQTGSGCGETLSAKLRLRRRYLIWVSGLWKLDGPQIFRDALFQAAGPDGRERMFVAENQDRAAVSGHKTVLAVAEFSLVKTLPDSPCGPASLLEVLLHTGRKHQIRVQCASRGYPVIGDRRYNGPRFPQMLLHAASITVPAHENFLGAAFIEAEYKVLPGWKTPFTIEF